MATKIADLFLRITAKNETGDVFDKIAEQVNGKLTGSITRGVLQANLLTAGFSAIATQAQKAVGAIQGGIAQATNLQLEQINAATTFASLTGKKYEEAVVVIENLNNRLAKSAEALPGATQDYKALATTIQDNVLEAFKGLNGEVDLKGFEDTVSSISESYGALTAASTRQVGNTAMGLTKALSGSSTAELRGNMFFEQNPVILNEIEKRLQQLNAKSLRDLDVKARVKLLEDVGKKFITDEFKEQAANSVDGLIQAFRSTLFDPTTGIFGLMKDLDESTDGTQSAFTAYNETLKALIGSDGLLGTNGPIAAIASVLGIDKLAYLKTVQAAFQKATVGIEALSQFMFNIAGMLDQGVDMRQMIVENLGNIRTRIGDWLGNLLANAGDGLARTLSQGASFLDQAPIGELLASVFNGLVDALGQVNLSGIGSQVGRIVVLLINQLAALLSNIDVGELIDLSFRAIGAMMAGIGVALADADWNTILSAGIKVIGVMAIAGLVQSIPVLLSMGLKLLIANLMRMLAVMALNALVAAVGPILASIALNFGAAILTAIAGIPVVIILAIAGLIALIIFKWEDITRIARSLLDGLTGFFSSTAKKIGDGVRPIIDGIEGFLIDAHAAVTNLFGKIRDKITDMIPFVGNQDASTTPAGGGGGFFHRILGRADGQIPVAFGGLLGAMAAAPPGRADGQIPVAFGGLLGAIGQEMAAAPPGTRPVIANSGEFILRPSQAQAFAAGAAMGGGGKTYTFSPTINLAAGTPESHAQEILRYFEIWLSEHQQASLA